MKIVSNRNDVTVEVTTIYPIRLLLDRLIYDCGQSPAQLMMNLGYADIGHDIDQLESWLASGSGPGEVIERVAAVYPAVESELRLAVAATIHTKRIEAADCECGHFEN